MTLIEILNSLLGTYTPVADATGVASWDIPWIAGAVLLIGLTFLIVGFIKSVVTRWF